MFQSVSIPIRLTPVVAMAALLLVDDLPVCAQEAASSSTTPEMVLVEGGVSEMGDTFGDGRADEKPVHTVTVSSFWMAKTEVTFDQYEGFCDETGHDRPSDQGWGRGDRPAMDVSWFEAAEYCNWLSRKEGFSPFYAMDGT